MGLPRQLPNVATPLWKDMLTFPVNSHGIPSPRLLSLSLTHSYTHAHTLALGSQSQQAQEKERRGQGAGAVGIPLLCWEHPGDNWEPGSWQHQHSLPPADTVPVPQPTKRAEAGLWDHRKAGGPGAKPETSDRIPRMGRSCSSQPDPPSAGPEEAAMTAQRS